jgi:hypothetical protein
MFGKPQVMLHKMPLSQFVFIVKASGYSRDSHRAVLSSAHFRTVVVGVPDLHTAIDVAKELVLSGAQLIELCGGFTRTDAQYLRQQLHPRIPVGVVTYDAEQEAEIARLFA